MQEKITSKNYSYIIKLTNEGKRSCFEILCQDKVLKRKSSITNLNFILSNIISLEIDDSKVEDSWITTSKKKAEKLFVIAMECFENKYWIEKLEHELDEDISLGGWNSNFIF
ncbi:MAG: hypothetical protein AABZ32_11640 [Bacteroidota bacterium]